MPVNDPNWRFRGFGPSRLGELDRKMELPKVSAASRVIPSPSNTNWNATFGVQHGTLPTQSVGSPSGTDWGRTFSLNDPASPTRTAWNKSFPSLWAHGGQGPRDAAPSGAPISARSFAFNLSPARDASQLSLGTDLTDFYKDRYANMDVNRRDHEMYGAGSDYGFNY